MTEIIPRATMEQIETNRHRACLLFEEAFDKLKEAQDMAGHAVPSKSTDGSVKEHRGMGIGDDAKEWLLSGHADARTRFVAEMTKQIDRGAWSYIIDFMGLEKFMDKKARDELRKTLSENPPPLTSENVFATMTGLVEDSKMIFQRGISNAFSGLDRRFRSHDGFKLGSRLILTNMYDRYGMGSYYYRHEIMRDVERVFYVLDGKAQPEYGAGICGRIDEGNRSRSGINAFQVEDDYFLIRVYKNGNAHMWFKRDDLLKQVNLLLADYYGEALGEGPDAVEPEFEEKHGRALTAARNHGFFPTPRNAASAAVEELRCEAGLSYLEPSAGTGNLIEAVRERLEWTKEKPIVTAIELQNRHIQTLRNQGLCARIIEGNFFEQSPDSLGRFDRIIMNPPFDRGRDIDHVIHALKFLEPDGRLVAIMSASTEFREDKKTVDFRKIVEKSGGNFRDLPPGSFAEVGTMVNTCIVTINGPDRKSRW